MPDPPKPPPPMPPPPPSGSDKPWPPIGGSDKIFALLVGINDYTSVPLGGCVKDVELLEQYLLANHIQAGEASSEHPLTKDSPIIINDHGNLYLCKLTDELATRTNIIQAFRHFLRYAKGGDVAWFHFSGHGSQQITAEEFSPFETNDRDQTLVCYDSLAPGGLMLADKELGLLIEEVSSRKPDGTETKTKPHIIITLDCCHSGTGTREQEGFIPRQLDLIPVRRSLDTYLEGISEFVTGGRVHLPAARHLLIAGCKSIETAGDTPEGGVFTTALLDALKTTEGNISYADLFIQTRTNAQKKRRSQTPQFETIGNFNPYVRFLDGTETDMAGNRDTYEVYHTGRHWNIRSGTIHGLPSRSSVPITVVLLQTDGTVIGEAGIDQVGALNSSLAIPGSMALDPDSTTGYRGRIMSIPAPPLPVVLVGVQEGVAALAEAISFTNKFRALPEPILDTEYTITAAEGCYRIRRGASGSTVFETANTGSAAAYSDDAVALIISALNRIRKWERTVELYNEASAIEGLVALHLAITDRHGSTSTRTDSEIELNVTTGQMVEDEERRTDNLGFLPKIRINTGAARKLRKDLHVYLLHLSEDFAITRWNYVINHYREDTNQEEFQEIQLMTDYQGWGPGFDDRQAVSYFKLLVTTKEIMIENFEQPALGLQRAEPGFFSRSKGIHDWTTATTKVVINRID